VEGATPEPASRLFLNYHPTVECLNSHPEAVKFAIGCSVHDGVLNEEDQCGWCEQEKRSGRLYLSISQRSKSRRETSNVPKEYEEY
jgi:hypothetical protein